MSVNFDVPTRVSMFVRLQENQELAWEQFVEEYGPMIAAWCLRHSLNEAEAADVTQTVLAKLIVVMRESKYDPAKGSFRGWLKTVTNNAVRDVMQTWKAPIRGTGDSNMLSHLKMLEDPHALDKLNECVESEYNQMLLREAERCVRKRVREPTWRAFELTAIESRSPQDAAKETHMSIAEVYVAKSRVLKMLKEEVRRQERQRDS